MREEKQILAPLSPSNSNSGQLARTQSENHPRVSDVSSFAAHAATLGRDPRAPRGSAATTGWLPPKDYVDDRERPNPASFEIPRPVDVKSSADRRRDVAAAHTVRHAVNQPEVGLRQQATSLGRSMLSISFCINLPDGLSVLYFTNPSRYFIQLNIIETDQRY